MNEYKSILEKLMQYYTSGDYANEVVLAKTEFYDLAGIFDEESENFELKMSQFIDWYIFSKKLPSFEQTPIELAEKKKDFQVTADEAPFLDKLFMTRHSLFEFLKIKDSDLYVKDLFSDYKLVIKNSPITVGFEKGQLFEARIIPHGETFTFTSGFCFHPFDAKKFILKEIKAVKKLSVSDQDRDLAREELIVRLFKMSYKFDQYKHVEINQIYSNDSKLRI